jgi:DNA polymerase IV
LLDGLRLERARVRLLGVGVSNLGDGDTARQLSLDVPEAPVELPWSDRRWEDVERVADRVAERFQGLGVSYAALLDDDDHVAAPTHEDRAAGDEGAGELRRRGGS